MKHLFLAVVTAVLAAVSLALWQWCGCAPAAKSPAVFAAQGGQDGSKGLFVLRPDRAGLGGKRLASVLKDLGGEEGMPLGGGEILVRLPLDKLREAEGQLGGAISPYGPGEKLAAALRRERVASQPGEAGSVLVDITLFRDEDKADVSRAVSRLGGAVLRGASEPGRTLRARLPRGSLEPLAALPQVV